VNINAINALIALGAVVISALTYWQTRRRTSAEIDETAARVRTELLKQIGLLVERADDLQQRVIALQQRVDALTEENSRLRDRLRAVEEENDALRRGVQRLVLQIRTQGMEPVWEPVEHRRG